MRLVALHDEQNRLVYVNPDHVAFVRRVGLESAPRALIAFAGDSELCLSVREPTEKVADLLSQRGVEIGMIELDTSSAPTALRPLAVANALLDGTLTDAPPTPLRTVGS